MGGCNITEFADSTTHQILEVQSSIGPYPSLPPPHHKPPLTSCSVPAPSWSAHSAALITNCRLPSVGEADHLLEEKASTPLSMARCTHNWSSTVQLYWGRAGRARVEGSMCSQLRTTCKNCRSWQFTDKSLGPQ